MSFARNLIPAHIKGWARYKRGLHKDFYPFGFAMNGQTARLETAREIIHLCGVKQIIETGTFRGTTTEWFAGFDLPVLSIESHKPSYEFSKRRLAKFTNVSLVHGDSVAALKLALPSLNNSHPTFIYLDAHWEDHLPLQSELNLICPTLSNFIILIDDFEVPGDPGYTFDNYGPGKSLSQEYLERCDIPGVQIFYPSTPSRQETGARRGWVILARSQDIVAKLKEIRLISRLT